MGSYSFVSTEAVSTLSLYRNKNRYKTTPKRSVSAPYANLECRPTKAPLGSTSFIRPSYNSAINFAQSTMISPLMTSLVNVCYERLKKSAYDSLQLGADIAEGRSTLRMVKDISKGSANVGLKAVANSVNYITSSATRLLTAYRALRRFDLRTFYSSIGVKPNRRKLKEDLKIKKTLFGKSEKFASSVWLTWWFGISPILDTIYTATQTLTGQLPGESFKASAKQKSSLNSLSPNATWTVTGTGITSVKMKCLITVNNPNAFLREQAGVNNPAAILWELIPFSFLVDWLVNISKVLSTMSDFSGCTLTGATTTQFASAKARDVLGPPGPADYVDSEHAAMRVLRTVGIIGPSLRLQLPERLSVTRAATAMSLLVLSLPKS